MSGVADEALELVAREGRYWTNRFILEDIINILDQAGFLKDPDDDG